MRVSTGTSNRGGRITRMRSRGVRVPPRAEAPRVDRARPARIGRASAVIVSLLLLVNSGCARRSQMWRVGVVLSTRTDPASCRIVDWRAAREGLVVKVEASSPVAGVVRKVGPSLVAPVAFRAVRETAKVSLVLIDYEFVAREEIYVGVITQAGQTCTMSPYFPERPGLAQAEWTRLASLRTAKQITREQSLEVLRTIAPGLPEYVVNPLGE